MIKRRRHEALSQHFKHLQTKKLPSLYKKILRAFYLRTFQKVSNALWMQLHEQKEKENSSLRFTSGQKNNNTIWRNVLEKKKKCAKRKKRQGKLKEKTSSASHCDDGLKRRETLTQQGENHRIHQSAEFVWPFVGKAQPGWVPPTKRNKEREQGKGASKQHPQNVARLTTLP